MKIGILGAGAIGCYLGGKLIAAGHEVVLVGRLGDEIRANGLELTDYAPGGA
ncbi:MAG: 2-dehydropantoate 2-reductase N-terminal domain-containing protein [Byssovorax sp.]